MKLMNPSQIYTMDKVTLICHYALYWLAGQPDVTAKQLYDHLFTEKAVPECFLEFVMLDLAYFKQHRDAALPPVPAQFMVCLSVHLSLSYAFSLFDVVPFFLSIC